MSNPPLYQLICNKGRRGDPTPDAYIGTFSPYTNVTATVTADFYFELFNANKTLDKGGTTNASSLGPTGMFGPEWELWLSTRRLSQRSKLQCIEYLL